jgi:hypothetical protein
MLAERPRPAPWPRPWQVAFRDGFAPLLSDGGLEALRLALLHDSPELVQGETAAFPDDADPDRDPPTGCCPLGYAVWKGEPLHTAAAVEAWWLRLYDAAERRLLGGPAGVWELLDFIDEQPRPVVRRGLMLEVGRELARRAAVETTRIGASGPREVAGG